MPRRVRLLLLSAIAAALVLPGHASAQSGSVLTATVGPGFTMYTYVCDPHAAAMRGSFTVGSLSPPPPAQETPKAVRLNATVGPGFTIALRTAAAALVRSLKAGAYTVVVRDRSRIHNFHLTGPGVNRATKVGFVGTATWNVNFRKGATYRILCAVPRVRWSRVSWLRPPGFGC